MANPDFTIKSGNTAPPLTATLQDSAGVAVDLSNTTVRFVMRLEQGGAVAVDRAAAVVSPTLGQVRYDWQAGDTAVAGYFYGEFRVTFANGAVQSFPSDSFIEVLVKQGLG